MARIFTPTRTPPFLPGAALLDLNVTTLLELGEAVQQGFPAATLDHFAVYLRLPLTSLLDLVGLSPSTSHAHHCQDRPLTSEVSLKLYYLAQVTEAAEASFEHPTAAHVWLRTPHLTFGHRTPLRFALLPGGAEYVTAVLYRLERGVYT